MKYLTIILLLCSCSSAYHLKKAEKHLRKAKDKGAITLIDTVYIDKEVIVPHVKTDTLVKWSHDTIRIDKERLKIKVKVDTVLKEVFVEGECEADTIRLEVPVTVTKILPGKKKGIWIWLLLAFIVGVLTTIYLSRK